MRKIISLILTLVLLFSFSACSGNFAQIDLKDSVTIPENGIIEKSVLDKIKQENAIATFKGTSGDIKYEWIIFGSDLDETRDVNLLIEIDDKEDLKIKFHEKQDLDFPALLSIHLNEKWTANCATAFSGEDAVYSVSITGSKTSILNISVNKIVAECNIFPNDDFSVDTSNILTVETERSTETDVNNKQKNESDDYLSDIKGSGGDVYIDNEEDTAKPSNNSGSYQTNGKDNYLSGVDDSEDHIYSDGKNTGKDSDKNNTVTPPSKDEGNDYLSGVTGSDNRIYSDGKNKEQDKYQTDPVPEGKPMPVEPENQEINKGKTYTCTFSIECSTILNNLSELDPDKLELVPSNGVILAPTTVTFYEGESVFDVLQRVCKDNNIHIEFSWTPIYNSAYIEGIHNLYEFDCGALSGWMYRVNGWYPNYGCSRYQLADGEVVEWRFTCDLGEDVGRDGSW